MANLEKEKIIEYFEEEIIQINQILSQQKNQSQQQFDFDLSEENIQNELVKKHLKNLILKIQHLKNNEIHFYNELLKDIPELEYFKEEVEDLNQLKNILKNIIVSIKHEENLYSLQKIIKSSEMFYFINKKTKKNIVQDDLAILNSFGEIGDYLQAIWKQVKQEEILGIILYIESGKASEDYQKFLSQTKITDKSKFLYQNFRKSFHNLLIKETDQYIEVKLSLKTKVNKVSLANYLDYGVIVDKEKKIIHIGFATANYNTKIQQKQFFKKMKILKNAIQNKSHELFQYSIQPIYVTNSFINENKLTQNEKQHQEKFLKSFEKFLSYQEKNLINIASFLSIVGNISEIDSLHQLNILDFISAKPYIVGSDSFWIQQEFHKIHHLPKNQQAAAFRNFLIDQAISILQIFEKLPNHKIMQISDSHAKVLSHVENLFLATIQNFNITNMSKKEIFNVQFIEKIQQFSTLYHNIHMNKFGYSIPNDNGLLKTDALYLNFSSKNDIIQRLERIQDKLTLVQNKNQNLSCNKRIKI